MPQTEPITATCTTPETTHRHLSVDLAVPRVNKFLGTLGRRGTTVCGERNAMDQTELDMWHAEYNVPPADRARIEDLPPCPACQPVNPDALATIKVTVHGASKNRVTRLFTSSASTSGDPSHLARRLLAKLAEQATDWATNTDDPVGGGGEVRITASAGHFQTEHHAAGSTTEHPGSFTAGLVESLQADTYNALRDAHPRAIAGPAGT